MKNKALIIGLIIISLSAIVFSTYAKLSGIEKSKDSFIITLHDVPDTNITINGSNLITKFYDEDESIDKELKIKIKDGELKSVYLNGKKLSKEEQEMYKKEIQHAMVTAKKAKVEIAQAKEEMENMDMENIYREIEDAQRGLENIDFEKINKEIEVAWREIEEINKQELAHSLALAKEELDKIDWNKINEELKQVQFDLQETYKFMESEEFQKSLDISINHIYDMIPEIPEIPDFINSNGIIITDYENDPNNGIDEDKENELDSKLRSLEKE